MKKNVIHGSIIGIIAFAWLAIAIFDFSIQLDKVLQTKTYTTLEEISKQSKHIFESKLQEEIQILNTAGSVVEKLEATSEEEAYDALSVAANIGGFDRVYSALPNGDAYFGSGIFQNIKEHEYFQKAILGKAVISTPSISRVNGEKVIILAVPIIEKEQVIRVICGVYSLDKADKVFLESSYYGEGYGFIASLDGDLILGTANEKKISKENNIFSFFGKSEFEKGYHVEQLREDMHNKKSGTFSIVYEGKERFASFVPTDVNDWYSITFATNVILQRDAESVSGIVIILALKLVVAFVVVLAYIVSIRRKNSKALNKANQEYESLLSNVAGGVIRSRVGSRTRDMEAIYLSDSFTEMTGYTMEDIKDIFGGKTCGIIYDDDVDAVIEEYERQVEEGDAYNLQYRVKTKSGEVMWVMDNGRVLEDGRVNQTILVDITQEKERADQLKAKAQMDALTGVYNKMSCQEMIDDLLSYTTNKRHALLMIDIDNFKAVNDTQGHAFGDLVLRDVGHNLNLLSKNRDIVGRIGGDEFVYFVPGYEDEKSVIQKAKEICHMFQCNHIGKKEDYKISCSVGIVFCKTETTFQELFEKADVSLYKAKEAGKDGYQIYEN